MHTFPCYSIDERVLNRKSGKQAIPGVDLNAVGATDDDLKAASVALHQNELIATGKNEVMIGEGPAGDGIAMVASQFFLRIDPQQGTKLSCKTTSDCTLSVYHSFVNSPDECYCPTCPEPIDAKSAEANEKSWHQHCGDFGFSILGNKAALVCPQVLCVAPNPVDCINNQCTFSGDSPPARRHRLASDG